MSEVLDGGIFVIKLILVKELFFVVGRLFLLFCIVWGMNVCIDNIWICFKFKVVENFFNVFYIKFLDVGEFLIMNENVSCKYFKGYYGFVNV